MSRDELVAAIKTIVGMLKAGQQEEAYAAYGKLFGDPSFRTLPPGDQRQALKLMVLAKGVPAFPGKTIADAHAKALPALKALVEAHAEPSDHELLGVCQVITGDEAGARATFQAGLDLERQRDPQSDLCGALMKRVASV